MKIQYVSKYLSLSREGLVPELLCPMDQGSLYPNQDTEENIFLYCLSCDYKNSIGLDAYNKIEAAVKNEI
jgi:DNA-directed RNA polymerase subunit M/transcription elongation factor TFIIS